MIASRTRGAVALTVAFVAFGCFDSTEETNEPNDLPAIEAGPADQSVPECGAAAFEVTATGRDLSYQWRKDGAPIAGASGSRLSLPRVGLADDGRQFGVLVSNSFGTVASQSATLHVDAANGSALIGPPRVAQLATDGSQLIWTDHRSLFGAAADCSAPVRELYRRVLDYPYLVYPLMHSGDVVWADYVYEGIYRTVLDGSLTELVYESRTIGGVWSLAVAGNRAYWIHGVLGIRGIELSSGSEPITLVPGPIDGGSLCIDKSEMYWLQWEGSWAVKKVSLSGGAVSRLASGLHAPAGLVCGDGYVYWSDTDAVGAGSINRMSVAGGEAVRLSTVDTDNGELVLSGGEVFFSTGVSGPAGSGAILRVSASGEGTEDVIADGLDQPFHVAADATRVYWTDRSGTWRTPRPPARPHPIRAPGVLSAPHAPSRR